MIFNINKEKIQKKIWKIIISIYNFYSVQPNSKHIARVKPSQYIAQQSYILLEPQQKPREKDALCWKDFT